MSVHKNRTGTCVPYYEQEKPLFDSSRPLDAQGVGRRFGGEPGEG